MRIQHQETSPTNRNDRVFAVNPLGKVPVLILPDGETIFDSGAICDHLDTLGTVRLIPEHSAARRAALRLQALAPGLCDAGITAAELADGTVAWHASLSDPPSG